MASKFLSPPEKCDETFRKLESTIFSVFKELIEDLEKRRDELLAELLQLKTNLDIYITRSLKNIQELESVKKGIESLEVERNETNAVIQASLNPIISKIKELEEQIPLPSFTFECDISPLKAQIVTLGKIQNVETYEKIDPHYEMAPLIEDVPPPLPPPRSRSSIKSQSKLNSPTPTIDKKLHLTAVSCYGDKSNISNPKAICYDEFNRNIYVISYDNPRIFVFSSKGNLVTKFGKKELQGPVGICVSENTCFVTDQKLNAIFKYKTKDFQLIKKRIFTKGPGNNQFGLFLGIAVDQFNQIHLVDNENNRISVYNGDLTLHRMYGQDYLHRPKDICISQLIYVLDSSYPHCLHGISWDGNKILSIISHDEIDTPFYFCLDPVGDFVISGVFEPDLKIFSDLGTYLYSAEVNAQKPRGLCLLEDTVACAYAEGAYVVYNIKL